MTDRFTLAVAQLNPTVGNITGNAELLRKAWQEASNKGADLLITGELHLIGYPPEDLVLRPAVQAEISRVVEELRADSAKTKCALLLTTPWVHNGKLHNAALLLDGGQIVGRAFKTDLPNYGVFDEKRVFVAGSNPEPILWRGIKLGVPICEDIWTPQITKILAQKGAELFLVPNGSPYELGKASRRFQLGQERVAETGVPLIYVNQVGGQDELIFDGGGFAVNVDGRVTPILPKFTEGMAYVSCRKSNAWNLEAAIVNDNIDDLASIYHAMVLGLRDYVNKNKFPGVVLGMSGGIDSGISAVVAVDALGADRVWCVMMPSDYTSRESLEDAEIVSRNLGVRYDSIPIAPAIKAYAEMLAPLFGSKKADATEENIQSRIRGMTLMALSNKFGPMVLTTGNKSEMSTGYATLYGDMCGGYSVLKDIYKTTVFKLCHWRNANRPDGFLGPKGTILPERIITKPPSAELRPDQTDEASLLPYPQLDRILEQLVEQEKSVAEIVAAGESAEAVRKVRNLLFIAEYKRRQAPPGVKISRRSFGRDRRYPITNQFRE